MQMHEYLALPAPRKGSKVKNLKTPAERFAHSLTSLMNDLAAEGWEFWRSECLPSEERKGLTGTTVVQNHLLIFRRPSAESLAEHLGQPNHVPAPSQPRADRPDPVLLERPSADQQVYDTRREPMFRSQTSGADDSRRD